MNRQIDVTEIFYILIQCTWGSVQTLAGFLLFLKFASWPHQYYYGAVYTRWNLESGISLGLFIFAPEKEEEWCLQMAVHEYGHTWQSLMLGPLYLVVIGIPSIVWARSKRCIELRNRKNLSYSAFYTERWADALGEKVLQTKSGQKQA